MKFLRRITKIDNGRYGVCSLPKPVLNDLLEIGATHLEFTWNERAGVLTAVPR
jgi:hypothetical protein